MLCGTGRKTVKHIELILLVPYQVLWPVPTQRQLVIVGNISGSANVQCLTSAETHSVCQTAPELLSR